MAIEIWSSAEGGWEPSKRVVNSLLRRMKVAGLRSDWEHCTALIGGDLLFCDNSDDTQTIEAKKNGGKWEFFTESGLKLTA